MHWWKGINKGEQSSWIKSYTIATDLQRMSNVPVRAKMQAAAVGRLRLTYEPEKVKSLEIMWRVE